MEGNAQWEEVDNEVDARFQMLATTNFDNPRREMGNWYTANCPIVSPMGKLGPYRLFRSYQGILLHQGCSNCGNPEWPNMVKKISSVIPTGHVVSAEGLPGNGIDAWHFSAAGYRTFGKRYAYEVLKVMGLETKSNADYTMADNLKKFYMIQSFENPQDITVRLGGTKKLNVTGKFADGHTELLSNEAVITSDDFTITDGVLKGTEAKKGTITISYTDFLGNQLKKDINVEVSDQGPNHVLVVDNGTAGSNSWDKQCNAMLNTAFAIDKIQFAFGLIGGKVYFDDVSCVEEGTTAEMVVNGNFESDDLSKWEVISWSGQKMSIEEYGSPSGIKAIPANNRQNNIRYNLAGQVVDETYKGIIILNGKKILSK
ncbi:MAG: hypothetical protein IJ159_07340 [Prevotella sp.]|nr:hypothetical protein [Prevotella sp.]